MIIKNSLFCMVNNLPSSRNRLLFIGVQLPENKKRAFRNVGISESLAFQLQQKGWEILMISRKVHPVFRFFDMVWFTFVNSKNFDIAIIDLFSGRAFIWAEICSAICLSKKKPYVLITHGGNLPQFSKTYPKKMGLILNNAEKVVSPSHYLKESLSSFRNDIIVIPNAIKLSSYTFRQRTPASPKLIWIRAFHEIYNPSLAPRILALLTKTMQNVRLTMVGPDKGDGSLQRMLKLASALDLQDKINIVGIVENQHIPARLDQGDIFINTTNFDNTPLSLIEAMACGLCIVSTNVGGIPYLLEDGVDALLVPPDDPGSMADAVKEVVSNSKLAATLSLNARKKVEKFDWSVVLPAWEELLNAIS